ncbi:high affinity Mn2+ porin [Oxalobacteraceae bacterium GrIS 1.11]
MLYQHFTRLYAVYAILAGVALPLHAEPLQDEFWNAHAQATYIWQDKAAFTAAYSSPYSLRPEHEKAYSFSATTALGVRPWRGGEVYLDAEVVQGAALSGLVGLAGMSNGEQQKTSGANPTVYRARLFLRHTIDLGGEREALASDANQLAGMVDTNRLVITFGNLAVTDIFDNNAVAHDARTQFLNWALLAHGAYDFAADARGYSWGAAIEYTMDDWSARAGRFLQPAQSNGLPLDSRVLRHYGDQFEIEHRHTLGQLPGKLRLLAFHNRAEMGGFRDALAEAQANGGAPDVARVRKDSGKSGFGVGAEQQLCADLTVFARASRNDGASEAYAFTEIERSLSAGAALQGRRWGRAADTLGLAVVGNGLSAAHRAYLAAGGHGAFIGDGRLNYRPEAIVEAYYSAAVGAHAWLTFDAQRISNPAYNADRGPVRVASLRLHAQY